MEICQQQMHEDTDGLTRPNSKVTKWYVKTSKET